MKKKSILSGILACVLALTLTLSGCSFSATFEAVLNEVAPAVLDVLQIVSIVNGIPVNPATVAKIDADVAALNKLYEDYEAAKKAGTDTSALAADIDAGFVVLNADLATIFSVAQVSDPVTQMKIAALILIIESAVHIAESILKPSAASLNEKALSPSDLAESYNKVLTAKTGNKAVDDYTKKHLVHNHGSLLRHLSLGIAK